MIWFFVLVTEAMFVNGSKISTSVLCNILQEIFILSLIMFNQVVSEEKSFEKLLKTTDDDNDGPGGQVS